MKGVVAEMMKQSDFKKMELGKKKVAEIVVAELGLERGPNERVIDQDTRSIVRYKDKDMVFDQRAGVGKGTVLFDPYNNIGIMGNIFDRFLDKYSSDNDIEVKMFYMSDYPDGTKTLFVQDEDNGYVSKAYKRENLCYVDMMLQLNGSEESESDMSEFDIPKVSKEEYMKMKAKMEAKK